MVDISRSPTIALGSIGAFQRVTPTGPVEAGLDTKAMQAAAGSRAQAASADGQAAGILTQMGVKLTEQGDALLKPFVKLAEAKQVMEAHDRSISAILSARGRIQALRDSGVPLEQLGQAASGILDGEVASAQRDVVGMAPAAGEVIVKGLQRERLKILGGIQKEATAQLVDKQKASWVNQVDFTKQEFFKSGPQERLELRAGLETRAAILAQSGVYSVADMTQSLRDFDRWQAMESPLYTAQINGFLPALDEIKESRTLTPEEKRITTGRVLDIGKDEIKAREDIEKLQVKSQKDQRQGTASAMKDIVANPNSSSELVIQTIGAVTELVTQGKLDESDGSAIRSAGYANLENKSKPVKIKDDPKAVTFWTNKIAFETELVKQDDLMQDPRVAENAPELLRQLRESRDRKHFTKSTAFDSITKQVNSVVPDELFIRMGFEGIAGFKARRQQAVDTLIRTLAEASKDTFGILSEGTIYKLLDPLVPILVDQLGKDFQDSLLQFPNLDLPAQKAK